MKKITLSLLAAGLAVTAACSSSPDKSDAASDTTDTTSRATAAKIVTTTTTEAPTTTTTEAPTTTTTIPEPKLADYNGKLYVTEQSCYGSAGGLQTVEVEITGPPEGRVTYEINGGERGPVIGTGSPGDAAVYSREGIPTATCSTRLTLRLVSLR